MIAYNRVLDFLRELGAECTGEFEAMGGASISEWRLGTQVFAVRGEASGELRLFRQCAHSKGGRPDPIMDALTALAMRSAPATDGR